jgi:hypothetical protein
MIRIGVDFGGTKIDAKAGTQAGVRGAVRLSPLEPSA